MDDVTTESSAKRIAQRRHSMQPMPENTFAGRGLVICAGGPRIYTNAYVLVHVLRHHLACKLPIEVWHFGPQEISPHMSGLLRELEAQPVDASAAMRHMPPQFSNPWQLKAYAIKWSQFREVLYLDADQVPVRDPTEAFAWSQFQERGAVFWPDIVDLLADNPIWKVCSLPPRRTVSIESGQLLMDKSRHWDSLDLALALNEEAQTIYRFTHGDKDTFLLGALLSGKDYAMIPGRPRSDVPWCLYQCDFDGRVLFQHRTGAKWSFKGPQQILPQFSHHEACERALVDLRCKWNGRVFTPPTHVQATQALEQRLTGQSFRYSRPGENDEVLQFNAGGEVKSSAKLQPLNWHIEDIASELVLVLTPGSLEPIRLRSDSLGTWWAVDLMLYPEATNLHAPGSSIRELLAATGFPSPISKLQWTELAAAFNLLNAPGNNVPAQIETIAAEHPPGVAQDQLRAIANGLAGTSRPPDLDLPSDLNVIPTRYTTRQPV